MSKRVVIRSFGVVLCLMMLIPLAAFGADKLVVKDAAGTTTVFSVDDTGRMIAKKAGFGTSNPASSIHLAELAGNFDRGLTIGQHANGGAAALINIKKSRGTDVAPTAVINADNIAAFHAQGYDGAAYQTSASVMFQVDGAPSAGNVPIGLKFVTGTATTNRPDRMLINSAGKVTIYDLVGTYTGGFAYVCVNNSGQIIASENPCP